MHFDVAIAGAGPAGLSAAYAVASMGRSVLVVEQNHEIGSPTRTSGGSFISDLTELGIPQELLHPVHRLRFLSLNRSAEFEYREPIMCVMDVRGVYQHLATTAAQAGAAVWPASKALDVLKDGSKIVGIQVETRTRKVVEISARVVIDATGYKGHLLRQAGLSPRFQRFGVGAEYDMYAPHCSQDEAVLVVGSQFAPSGYAWAAPWGKHRVRVGVGVIHPDHDADPVDRLDSFVAGASKLGVNLEGAQPIEYHFGLIPSDIGETFVGEGILATGDAAGHASTLVGEGIRWAIKAGRMAGTVAANAIEQDDVSAAFLSQFQSEWLRRYGRNLRIANMLNRKMSRWDDKTWDERTELLGLLSPDEFGRGLQTEFSVSWALGIAWAHPRLVKAGFDKVLGKLGIG
ncbi:MAG TPA: NAD(P)/FAD-dependent oxidoreductase [Bryobacteraceae bacterium]|jgi:digeranylgeranylglycerophospholipid reductase|nr:NAD(P)/FAD-dependent oxidoreductase [Bryobacteraceae bacterium]